MNTVFKSALACTMAAAMVFSFAACSDTHMPGGGSGAGSGLSGGGTIP